MSQPACPSSHRPCLHNTTHQPDAMKRGLAFLICGTQSARRIWTRGFWTTHLVTICLESSASSRGRPDGGAMVRLTAALRRGGRCFFGLLYFCACVFFAPLHLPQIGDIRTHIYPRSRNGSGRRRGKKSYKVKRKTATRGPRRPNLKARKARLNQALDSSVRRVQWRTTYAIAHRSHWWQRQALSSLHASNLHRSYWTIGRQLRGARLHPPMGSYHYE
jgi:hypothetical protein